MANRGGHCLLLVAIAALLTLGAVPPVQGRLLDKERAELDAREQDEVEKTATTAVNSMATDEDDSLLLVNIVNAPRNAQEAKYMMMCTSESCPVPGYVPPPATT